MPTGFKHSLETRKKMSLAAKLRDNAPRLAAIPKGKAHWNWNERPSILALHKRLHRQHGRAKDRKCATKNCKNQAHDWANVTGKYTDNIKDYKPLCRSCHLKRDRNWIKKV